MIFAVGFCGWRVLAMNSEPTTHWDVKNRSTLDYVETGNKMDGKETEKYYKNSAFKQGPGFSTDLSEEIRKTKHTAGKR